MNLLQARARFAALAQETRLRIVRKLVAVGAKGMAAGALADAMGVSASNLSFHLKDLSHAGLISQRRAARQIIYTADYSALSALIRFLMEDCCSGRPEVCAPVLNAPCRRTASLQRTRRLEKIANA